MSVYRIARGLLAYCPRDFHLRRVHHRHDLGLGQPIRIVQYIRTQKYSTDESTSELDDIANRVTKLETAFSTMMEDGFKKLKDELKDELAKSLAITNDGIKDLRSWVRLIVGTFGVGIMLKIVFYDRYMEEKLGIKIKGLETRFTTMIQDSETRLTTMIQDSETRLTTMIQNAITQLKLELKIEHQELLLSGQNKKNK